MGATDKNPMKMGHLEKYQKLTKNFYLVWSFGIFCGIVGNQYADTAIDGMRDDVRSNARGL